MVRRPSEPRRDLPLDETVPSVDTEAVFPEVFPANVGQCRWRAV